MNRKLKKFVAKDYGCFIVAGNKGAGKSTTLALFSEVYKKLGYKVFCQYPTKDTYQIPMTTVRINGVDRSIIDKQWLYSHNFQYSCILIDEGKNVWPNRDWSKWTKTDDDFFDFLRHTHTVVVIATLCYDQLDVNIRRVSDYLLFLNEWFWHFTKIEISRTLLVKVSDKSKEIIGYNGKRGMIKTNYEVAELPLGNYNLWRKSYYNTFLTEHIIDTREEPNLISWPKELFK